MVRMFCFASFTVLFFSNWNGLSIQFQVLGVFFLLLSAMSSLYKMEAKLKAISLVEILFLWSALSSLFASMITSNGFVFVMSLVGSAAFASVAIIRRSIDSEELAKICAYSFCTIVPIALAIDFTGYLTGISAEWTSGIGLLRFRPLGLHPNLTGFLFGFGALLTFYFFLTSLSSVKYIFLATSILSVSFVLAASSRAGIVAILGAIIFSNASRLRFQSWVLSMRLFVLAFILLLIMVPVVVYSWPHIEEYIVRIMDLESETRGLGTGGTGRVNLWLLSLHDIQNRNFVELLFGTGFRSSSAKFIGYNTESSYFTLILENGLVFTFIFVPICMIWGIKQIRLTPNRKDIRFLMGTLMIFVLLESVFNRYMLAFGNPASLLSLVIYSGIGVLHTKAYTHQNMPAESLTENY